MNQQNRRIVRVLACLILSLAVVVLAALLPFFEHRYELPPSLNVDNHTLEGIDIASISEWDDDYMAVYYPRTQNEQVNMAVLRYINNAIAGFKAGMTPSRRADKDEFSISFRVFRFDEDIVSFLFQGYTSYVGAANGEDSIRTMVFDLTTGDELGIAAVFETQECLETLSKAAFAQLKTEKVYEIESELEMLKEGTAPTPENFEHFLLDGNILRLYFPRGQVGSRSNPVDRFELPLEQVRRLLRTRFAAHLPPEPEPETVPQTLPPLPAPTPDIEGLEGKKIIALTFDDGPHPKLTPKLLNYLKKQDVKATFCVLGCWVETSPEIVARAAAEGHQIASHTYHHKDLTKLSPEKRQKEIDDTSALIASVIGYPPSLMRPPYGARDADVQAAASTPLLLWNIDPKDWKRLNAEKVSAHVIERAKNGDIILLHDFYPSTIDAVKIIVPALKEKGFTFVTVDQMLALRGGAKPGELIFSRPKAKS